MASPVTQINVAADTYSIVFNRINELANLMTNEVVTANSDANGATVSGNSFVTGILGATVLTANTLRGGNVQSSANLHVSGNVVFQGNVDIEGDRLKLGPVEITNTTVLISTLTMNVDTTVPVEFDNFEFSEILGQEYILQTGNRNNNEDTQISKILVVHNQATAFLTEYAQIFSNIILSNITANANATHVRVYFNGQVPNTSLSSTKIPVFA